MQLLLAQELFSQHQVQAHLFQQWVAAYRSEIHRYYTKKIDYHLSMARLYAASAGTEFQLKDMLPAAQIATDIAEEPQGADGDDTDVTDAQWQLVASLLPLSKGRGRPYADDRRTLNGVRFVLMHHIGWNHMPARYGSYVTCWRRYVRWQSKGVWNQAEHLLQQNATSGNVTSMSSGYQPMLVPAGATLSSVY